jgi:hypothetical protein
MLEIDCRNQLLSMVKGVRYNRHGVLHLDLDIPRTEVQLKDYDDFWIENVSLNLDLSELSNLGYSPDYFWLKSAHYIHPRIILANKNVERPSSAKKVESNLTSIILEGDRIIDGRIEHPEDVGWNFETDVYY